MSKNPKRGIIKIMKSKNEAVSEEKAVAPKEVKKNKEYKDIDSSAFVNEVKGKRAFAVVFGGAKAGSAEAALVGKLRGEFAGEELVTEVYKGLGGLLDGSKAKVNRANEAKEKKNKASR